MSVRKAGSTMGLAWSVAAVSLLLGLACAVVPFGRAEEKRAERKEAKGALSVGTGFSQAMLATQLALQGDARKSPMLLLAAAELVRDLKESGRPTKEVRLVVEGAKGSDTETMRLTVSELADKAIGYAKGDKELGALVQKRAEQLTSRGLDPSAGAKLPTTKIKDTNYKVLASGIIPADSTGTLKNVPFVEERLAMVAAISENANLILEVRDESGRLIANPPDFPSRFITLWMPRKPETVTISVRNNGAEQKFALLANWD